MEKENGEDKKVNSVDLAILKLHKPFHTFDGKVIEELSLDVDTLNMNDLHQLEIEYGMLFPTSTPTNGVYMTDTKYQALVVAKINGINYDSIKNMGGRDAFTMSNRLGRFLTVTV